MSDKQHRVVVTAHPKWYILFLFPGLVCIIAGAILWGTADHQRQLLVDNLTAEVTSYNSTIQPLLAETSFNLTVYANFSGEITDMSESTDIPKSLQQLINDKTIPSYNELYFSYTGQIFSTCPAPIPPFGNAPTGPIAISAFFNNSVASQINSGELPLYVYSTVAMSMREDCPDKCAKENGGYFDEKAWTCTTFKVLSSVCMSVYFDGEWKLNSEAPGCFYPFDSMAVYTPWRYDMNSSLHFDGSVSVRAVADPLIYYGNITLGTLDINSSVKNKTIAGRDLFVAGLPVLAVGSGVIGTLLYIRNVKRKKLRKNVSVEIKKHVVWPFAGVSFLGFAIVLCIGVPLISHWSEEPTFNAASFIGVIIIFLFTPVAWVGLLLFWSSVFKSNEFENARKFSTVFFSFAIVLITCVLTFSLMVKPWAPYGTGSNQTDALQQMIGILFLTFLLPFMGATLLLLFPLIKRKLVTTVSEDNGSDSKLAVANESSSLLEKVPPRKKTGPNVPLIILISFVFVFLPLILLGVFLLPPIWNVPITVYRSFVSPNSVVQWMPWGTGPTDFTFKFYIDTLVFYGCLCGFILIGLLIKFITPLGVIFHKRFRLPALPFEIIGKAPYAFVGEVVFCLSWLGICSWWFYYWYAENSRISALTDITERLARTLGHMTNIAMASLLFPVARNSIWSVVFGIAFERAIQFHRWAGAIAFGSLTLHMIIWFANWWIHGSLLHNMFAIQNIPHADNWTMPIMIWITWLGCLIMIVFALDRFRRKNFELFYYVHHFYIVIYFTGLIHAWSFWYPLAPSLFLYFVDRLIRYFRSSSSTVTLESMEYGYGKHTKLTLKVNESQTFVYEAGQYAWINIPAIDPLQWHPFSISSAPEDDLVTFHIKNMGKETWTGRLGTLAKSHAKKPYMTINSLNVLNSENIVVNVDGPYGNPMISPYNYDVVVLVCGGIGVTPMHSMLMHLFNRYYNDDIPTFPQKVYFMWNVRESSTIAMFYDSFTKIESRKSDGAFNLILNVTDKNSKLLQLIDTEAIPYKIGRMDLRKEFTDVKMNSMSGSVGVFVCGPTSMVNEVSDLAFGFEFDFHTETFAL